MNIYPYKPGSRSAKDLAQSLGVKRIKHRGSRFRPSKNKIVLNWGSSRLPDGYDICQVWNQPEAVAVASNKLSAFNMMSAGGGRVPLFTTSHDEAVTLLQDGPVVCRTILTGHSGRGIVIAKTEQELVAAPLYTKYIHKKSEWRIHFFRDEVIFCQQKARRLDFPDDEVNWQVRNHANGFIYRNQGLVIPEDVIKQAKLCFEMLGLDFGAVDVVYNEKRGEAYVLEVNCAPGLEGTTLERYTDAIKSVMFG